MRAVRLSAVIVGLLLLLGAACRRTKRHPGRPPAPTSAAKLPPAGFCPAGAQYVHKRAAQWSYEHCLLGGVRHGPSVSRWLSTGGLSTWEWYDHGELLRAVHFGEGQSSPHSETNYAGTHRRERFWDVKADRPELVIDESYLGDELHGRWMRKTFDRIQLRCYEHGVVVWLGSKLSYPDFPEGIVNLNAGGRPADPTPPWSEIEKRPCPTQFEFPVPGED